MIRKIHAMKNKTKNISGNKKQVKAVMKKKPSSSKSLLPKTIKKKNNTKSVLKNTLSSKRPAAKALNREDAERYRNIIENIADGYFEVDLSGNFTFFNDAVCLTLGYSRKELTGKNNRFYTDKENAKIVFQAYNKVYKTGKTLKAFGYHITRKDGSKRYIEGSVSLLINSSQKPIGFWGIMDDFTERKQAEESLQEAARDWQATFDAVGDAICLLDKDQRILRCNRTMAGMFGVKQDKLIGQRCWEVVHGTKEPIPECPVIRIKSSLVREETDIRVKNRWFNVIADPILNETGAIRGIVHIVRDITERKRIEEELRREEQRFRILAEQSSDIIAIVSREGFITYENPAVERFLGIKTEERIGFSIFDRIHPDDLKFATDVFKAFTFNKSSKDIYAPVREIRLRHYDGSWRTFETMASKLLNNNNVEAVIINLRDITKRKKAEKDLQESEELFRNLFRYHAAVKLIIDPDTGCIIDANEAAIKYYGWPREQITRMKIQDINMSEPEEIEEAMEKVRDQKRISFEFRHRRADGSIRDVEIFSSNIKVQGNDILHTIVYDITERKREEEELNKYRDHLEELVRERTAELEAFSYSVSHDLRAPLRTIDGFGQALLEDYDNKLDAQGKDYLTRIRTATSTMAELIEDMLKLSRITRSEMDIIKVNLSNIAKSITDELRKSQPQRIVNIKIADSLEDWADPRLMRIVLENLLGNAWKFTGEKEPAEIEFGLIKKDEAEIYFVRDNGAGFDMEYAHKLFAPFQRLHNIEEYPGTGIGLAIIKRIIHRHGGKVWAEGEPDKGATFYFTLR
jgi:PAS domain S-box-containing protein